MWKSGHFAGEPLKSNDVERGMELSPAVQEAALALKTADAQEVYVYGSHARGLAEAGAEIDFAVRGLEWMTLHQLICDLPHRVGAPMDIVSLDEPTAFSWHLEGVIRRGRAIRVA
jgi:predicted nucleotidyltransferase